jgi:hypothetical protein
MIAVTGFKGMDKGEAESYAQLKKINAEIIISDDKGFTTALGILDPYIKVYNTLHLICWLDKQSLVPNWNALIKQIHLVRPFKSTELHTAYHDILKRFGINESKRSISKKCSLKNILSTP